MRRAAQELLSIMKALWFVFANMILEGIISPNSWDYTYRQTVADYPAYNYSYCPSPKNHTASPSFLSLSASILTKSANGRNTYDYNFHTNSPITKIVDNKLSHIILLVDLIVFEYYQITLEEG
jgi:hypothetical protein